MGYAQALDARQTGGPIAIAAGCDDEFAMPLAVALYSALVNLEPGRAAHIYLLEGGISAENRRKVERAVARAGRRARLEWLPAELGQLADLAVAQWHTSAAYLRLRLPQLLPPEVERVIYLDCDLVVEGDLARLWDMPLGGRMALGVQNFHAPRLGDEGAIPEPARQLGLDPHLPYCNNGVMVINIRRWREERMLERVVEFTRRFSAHIHSTDQDGVNAVIAGDWGLLDPRWNVQLLTLRCYGLQQPMADAARQALWDQILRDAHILHYAGRRKPWNLIYLRAGGERFLHYLGRCGWLGAGFVPFAASRRAVWDVISSVRRLRDGARGLLAGRTATAQPELSDPS